MLIASRIIPTLLKNVCSRTHFPNIWLKVGPSQPSQALPLLTSSKHAFRPMQFLHKDKDSMETL